MIAARLPLLRRLMMMVGGEAMQSGFHFALNIVLIHRLSAHDYGIFALGMMIGGFGLSYIRSLTAIPASICIGRNPGRMRAYAFDVTFSSAALILTSVMGLLAAGLLTAWGGSGVLACGAFVALWSFRSHLRTCNFAYRHQWLVGIGDLVFTLCGILASAYVLWRGGDMLPAIFVALAFANACGVAVLLAGLRRPIRFSARTSVRRRWHEFWKVLRWSAFGATTTNLQGQCLALLVATFAGPAAFAPIAAVIVMFAPLRIIATALVNMMQPEISSLLARGAYEAIWSQATRWTALMGLGGLVYGAIVLALLPYVKSQALENAHTLFIGGFAWAIFFLTMLYVMPRIILEVLGEFKAVAIITSWAAVFSLVTISALLAAAPPIWSLAGAAGSEALVGIASWMAVHRRLDAFRRQGLPVSAVTAGS